MSKGVSAGSVLALVREARASGIDRKPIVVDGARSLVPLLARVLSVPLFGDVGLALVLIVNLAALGAGIALHRLVREETGDRVLSARAVSWRWTAAETASGSSRMARYGSAV